MPERPLLKRRPREWTDEQIAIAHQFPRSIAAQKLGKTVKAVERLRARVRERQLMEYEYDDYQ